MKFCLIDSVLEHSDDRVVAIKQVSLAEEYLGDHFPGFPVLPGVMMVEAMVQAARQMLQARTDKRLVLGEVKAIKFGSMVRPGERLVVEVTLAKESPEDCYHCKAVGRVQRASETSEETVTAVGGRFTMRPVRPS